MLQFLFARVKTGLVYETGQKHPVESLSGQREHDGGLYFEGKYVVETYILGMNFRGPIFE